MSDTPVEVHVEVAAPEPVAVTQEPAPVVVAEAPQESATEAVVTEAVIDHAAQIAELTARVEAAEREAREAREAAAIATAVAVEPEPEPEPVIVEAEPEPAVVEDTAPDNEHPFFRRLGRWGL